MPVPSPISFQSVSRRFEDTHALRDVSFDVAAGRVTALLGPNGAGKTTLLRALLGLDRPDSGAALLHGQHFADLDDPLSAVGALIDGAGFHPGRTAEIHLRILADHAGLDHGRIEGLLERVGLTEASGRMVGGFSLGMRQRLGLASALLGDPSILVLDEPANGLDPAGMRWLRSVVRAFADNGGTVLVSSHVLDEIEHIADDVVVLVGGTVRSHRPLASLLASSSVVVRSPDLERLLDALPRAGDGSAASGFAVSGRQGDRAELVGIRAEMLGRCAAELGVVLHELRTERHRLEDVFLDLTNAPTAQQP